MQLTGNVDLHNLWDRGTNKMVSIRLLVVWLVIDCIVHGNPRIHPSSPLDSGIHHSLLLDTVKNRAYGAGLYRRVS